MPDSHVAPARASVAGPAPEAPSLLVIGSADTCTELMAHPKFGQADVLLLDLPDADGGSPLIERLVHQCGVKLVVLAASRDPAALRDSLTRAALPMGVAPAAARFDTHALDRRPADGNGPELTRTAVLLRRSTSGAPPLRAKEVLDDATRRHHALTAKEREVVRQMVKHRGTKNHAIALELGISEHTLRNHLTVIYSKLGVQGKLNLYVYALEHGLAGTDAPAPAPRQMLRWRPGDPDRRASPAN